jgi:TetR/AcrR family transcriptional regulator, tetracycline repressor protein
MRVVAKRSPGQRAGLTRAQVLNAAHELLVERGLDALTMRALAERLGVAPNTLYSHVPSKTALIDELLDDVLAEVDAPAADSENPIEALHAIMASTYDVLLVHRDLIPLYVTRQGARGPNAQRLGEIMLPLLARVGVSGARAREARRVLIVYTIGFAAFATRASFETHAEPPLTEEELFDNFDSGLRWLLVGIAGSPRTRVERSLVV